MMSTSPRTTEFTSEPTDNAMSETTPGPAGGIEQPATRTEPQPGTHHPGRLGFKTASVPAPLYVVLAGLVLPAAITGNLPDSMVVGFAATILLGGLFIWIGNL